MAKQRYIDTHFWDDSFIESLRPYERYLFMYFLTNPHTNICGVYELSLKKIASESALTEDRVKEIMKQFEDAKKIFYIDGWVYVKNFIRHQTLNPKVQQGIKNKVAELPKQILDKIIYLDPNNSLSIDTEQLEPELELKSKPKLESFERFWSSYPRKIAKKNAQKVWFKISPSEVLMGQIMLSLVAAKVSDQWRKDEGKFIPHPATWLNQERWNDELSPPRVVSKNVCQVCGQYGGSMMQQGKGWIHMRCT